MRSFVFLLLCVFIFFIKVLAKDLFVYYFEYISIYITIYLFIMLTIIIIV